ncbi:hypothetical protein [uncultured Amnibacterium sp.]|uniref:hypothetical protein n=1 Tax=uncultured Amnibacterium sp. TaxID=1631851 RepID=UPI0035C9DD41
MRLPPVIDPAEFAPAELSALQLDGDCFSLGDCLVAVDQPVDAATRAATIAVTVRPGLVAERRTAAWVHGATWLLQRPLQCSIDRSQGRRTVPAGRDVREVRFAPQDVQVIGGVTVTTPLRTAIDLARLEPDHPDIDRMIRTLLRMAGVAGGEASALLHERGPMPHKRRGVDRLASLALDPNRPALF